jgi:hypothetical protein
MTPAANTSPLWLVFEYPGQPLTLNLSGVGETLPVFSLAEEAGLFLRLTAGASGMRAEKVTGEELISLISRPCLGVERIALDLLGREEALVRLLRISRQDYLSSSCGRWRRMGSSPNRRPE